MQDFDEVNPHLALCQSESYVSPEEKRWESFLRELEKRLVLDHLDGDQDEDGYSMDLAFDMFTDGLSARSAATEFRVLISEAAVDV